MVKARDQHEALIAMIKARKVALAIDLSLLHWTGHETGSSGTSDRTRLPVDLVSLQDRRDAVDGIYIR